MAVRSFSGTSWIRFPGFNLNGAFTLAALVKMTDTTVPSGWQAIGSSADASTHSQVTHYIRGTVASTAPLQGVQTLDITSTSTGSNGAAKVITSPATWKVIVMRRAGGTSTPRVSQFPIGGAWTHENGDTASSNPASHAGGQFYVGAYADPSTATLGDFTNIRLALYAVWGAAALTDLEAEALATGLATSAWTGHSVAPSAVWEFSQASTGTAVTDLVGSNTQTAITSTTVVTGDDPAGWTFAGGSPATVLSPLQTFGPSYAAQRAASY